MAISDDGVEDVDTLGRAGAVETGNGSVAEGGTTRWDGRGRRINMLQDNRVDEVR